MSTHPDTISTTTTTKREAYVHFVYVCFYFTISNFLKGFLFPYAAMVNVRGHICKYKEMRESRGREFKYRVW